MTEKKRPIAHEKNSSDIPLHSDARHHIKQPRPLSLKLILYILVLFSIIMGLFAYYQWLSWRQQLRINQLQAQSRILNQALHETSAQEITFANASNDRFLVMQKQLQQDQHQLAHLQQQVTDNNQTIVKLSEHLWSMSASESNNWLLSEANYLVTLAGRKIWQDQDYVTARLLLTSADKDLAATSDSSLLPARKAIQQDLAAIAAIDNVDIDGIQLQLQSLANQVSTLPLVKNYDQIDASRAAQHRPSRPIAPISADASVLTQIQNSLARFYQSLLIFIHHFVQIEPYNEFADCVIQANNNKNAIQQCKLYRGLITPEQSLYLRENIRLQLYIAAQAAGRHHAQIYQQALNDVSLWLYGYFDVNNAAVHRFIETINSLAKQPIDNTKVPTSLKSMSILDNIMQTRIRSLLTAK